MVPKSVVESKSVENKTSTPASTAGSAQGQADNQKRAVVKDVKIDGKIESKVKNELNANGLTKSEQKQIDRAASYMRAKNWPRAEEAVSSFASSAGSLSSCMYAMEALSHFGGAANKSKRACFEKAISLAQNNDELMDVALKARQCELFDLSREAFDKLVGSCDNLQDLTLIAREAQKMSMGDLSHLAMQKAYTRVDNIPDALQYARDSYSFGLEDLTRKCLKDLLEDQESVHGLLEIAGKIEPLHMNEMIRFALVRALDKAKTVDQMLAVYNAAKHYGEEDVVKVAQYRGRKMLLQKKLKDEAASTPQAVADQQKKSKEDQLRSTLEKPSGF